MASASINQSAQTLRALHKPGSPVILANVWDVPSTNALVSLNSESSDSVRPVKAIATASWAIAATHGLADADLTMVQNLEAISRIAPIAERAGLPLSVDLQDGYGPLISAAVQAAVEYGAAGANIEDCIPGAGLDKGISGCLYMLEEQVDRLRLALEAARKAGAPDFVLNARCDVFTLDDSPDLDMEARLAEGIRRGKAYLEAGATTVFFFGAGRSLGTKVVERLIEALDGRVAVMLSPVPGAHTTAELAEMGVARISVGPSLYFVAMNAFKQTALQMLTGGGLTA